VVRNEIQDFASTRTIFSNKFKLIILDECDAMTKDAQFALRRGEPALASITLMEACS
jgi:replication factor C subunit 3/5